MKIWTDISARRGSAVRSTGCPKSAASTYSRAETLFFDHSLQLFCFQVGFSYPNHWNAKISSNNSTLCKITNINAMICVRYKTGRGLHHEARREQHAFCHLLGKIISSSSAHDLSRSQGNHWVGTLSKIKTAREVSPMLRDSASFSRNLRQKNLVISVHNTHPPWRFLCSDPDPDPSIF